MPDFGILLESFFIPSWQSLYTDIFVFNIFVLSATFLKDKLIDPSKTYSCIKIQRDPIANENWDGFNGHRSLHFGDRSIFMLTWSYFHQAGFHPRGCHVYVWGIHIHPCVCMRYPMVTIHPFSISSCRSRECLSLASFFCLLLFHVCSSCFMYAADGLQLFDEDITVSLNSRLTSAERRRILLLRDFSVQRCFLFSRLSMVGAQHPA